MTTPITRSDALRALWKRGNLTWKLDNTQQQIYKHIQDSNEKINVVLVSRRCGKSRTLLILALEQCLKFKNSIVLYLTPEQKQTKTIVRPLLTQLLEDCPTNLRPEYKAAESLYRFSNGSEIRLVGTDGEQYESQRGIDSHLCIIDEAGFVDAPLHYIIQSVLIPTTLHTKGKIILSSTPPKRMDHPFIEYIRNAEVNNTLMIKTIYDFPRIPNDEVEDIARSLPGGKAGATFRREFLCMLETSDDINVIPEMTNDMIPRIVRDWDKPAHYDYYVGMDLGYKDATGIVWAFFDYMQQKLVFVDEWICAGRNVTLSAIAQATSEKEQTNFYDVISGKTKPPYMRVSDTDLIILNDLHINHKTHYQPAKKYDKQAIIAQFRHAVGQERIIIHPRCRNLILQMKHASWNKNKTDFERSETMYHFDLLAAAIYLYRSVDWKKNPYPKGFDFPNMAEVHINPNYKEDSPYEYVLNMFRPKTQGLYIKSKK